MDIKIFISSTVVSTFLSVTINALVNYFINKKTQDTAKEIAEQAATAKLNELRASWTREDSQAYEEALANAAKAVYRCAMLKAVEIDADTADKLAEFRVKSHGETAEKADIIVTKMRDGKMDEALSELQIILKNRDKDQVPV